MYAFGAGASAAQVSVAWDPSPDSDAAGYTVHWGNGSGNYTASQDVGASLQHTVVGLDEGKTYYFAVTAYDGTGTRVSPPSNELTKVLAPKAGFSVSPASGSSPLTVSFQNTTVGSANQWSWDFGDGSTGSARDPSHLYTQPGTYTVSLTATGPGGSNTAIQNNAISVSPDYQPPTSGFVASPTSGTAPLSVAFNDQSNGDVTEWLWNFGDGSASTHRNPTHVYTSPGAYTVSLLAKGPAGQDTKSVENYVVVNAPDSAPQVDFTIQNASGPAPLVVTLTDTSTGEISNRNWDFGDGSSGNSQTAVHTYGTPGTYAVTLSVSGPGGSDVKTVTGAVKVTESAPIASFGTSTRNGPAPLTVTFTDTSQGDVSERTWNFGDGKTGGGAIAVYTYSKPGTYSVSLAVSGPGGSDTATKAGHITVTDSPVSAEFAVDETEGTAPLTVKFSNLSEGDINSWLWDFGDGSTGSSQFPSHTYKEPGSYTVALTASGPDGSDTETKRELIQVRSDDTDPDTSGLVAAYGFGSLDEGRVRDASGNGNDGSVRGAVLGAEGRFGAALQLDGVDDWVTIADADSLDLNETLTLEAWVKPSNVGNTWQSVVIKEQAGAASYYLSAASHFGGPAGGIFIGDEQIATANRPLVAEEWTHLATTYDGTVLKLYVNGTLAREHPVAGWIQQSDGVLRIGGNSIWGEYFGGLIDEVRVYNRALAVDEIQLDMEQPVEDFMEFGEVTSNHVWTRVDFDRRFRAPIVVVKPMSSNGGQPAVVRIRNVDPSGFEVRIQEWDYLDGRHAPEQFSYLVIEKGTHVLSNGSRIEAGDVHVSATRGFESVPFTSRFPTTPVLLSSVATYNNEEAVVTRQLSVSDTAFDLRLQEQEANAEDHPEETVHYVAWEPSTGTLGEFSYEVAFTDRSVSHALYSIAFSTTFSAPPAFLADMQSQRGGDTANLRSNAKSAGGIDIRVAEEQSKDAETKHAAEQVGFVAIGSKH
jgi:PKD repeat protein